MADSSVSSGTLIKGSYSHKLSSIMGRYHKSHQDSQCIVIVWLRVASCHGELLVSYADKLSDFLMCTYCVAKSSVLSGGFITGNDPDKSLGIMGSYSDSYSNCVTGSGPFVAETHWVVTWTSHHVYLFCGQKTCFARKIHHR